MKTVKELIKKSGIPGNLIRAVVRQNGGWESFQQAAEDIANHGASAGWNGFTYHVDTVKFYNRNRDTILSHVEETAAQIGTGSIQFVQSFRGLGKEYSFDEIGRAFYGPKSKIDTQIANVLAWFALEEVAKAYVDALED